jgi:hypothetical protein
VFRSVAWVGTTRTIGLGDVAKFGRQFRRAEAQVNRPPEIRHLSRRTTVEGRRTRLMRRPRKDLAVAAYVALEAFIGARRCRSRLRPIPLLKIDLRCRNATSVQSTAEPTRLDFVFRKHEIKGGKGIKMTTPNMIEEVAQAIVDAEQKLKDPHDDPDRTVARAAVMAMLEPTPRMVADVADELQMEATKVAAAWMLLIGAALKPPQAPNSDHDRSRAVVANVRYSIPPLPSASS